MTPVMTKQRLVQTSHESRMDGWCQVKRCIRVVTVWITFVIDSINDKISNMTDTASGGLGFSLR